MHNVRMARELFHGYRAILDIPHIETIIRGLADEVFAVWREGKTIRLLP